MKKNLTYSYLILDFLVFIGILSLLVLSIFYNTSNIFIITSMSYISITSIAGIITAIIQKNKFFESIKNNINHLIPVFILDIILFSAIVILCGEIVRNIGTTRIVTFNLFFCLFLLITIAGQFLWELFLFRNYEKRISFSRIYIILIPCKILLFLSGWLLIAGL